MTLQWHDQRLMVESTRRSERKVAEDKGHALQTWQMEGTGKEVSQVSRQVADDGGCDPRGFGNDGF